VGEGVGVNGYDYGYGNSLHELEYNPYGYITYSLVSLGGTAPGGRVGRGSGGKWEDPFFFFARNLAAGRSFGPSFFCPFNPVVSAPGEVRIPSTMTGAQLKRLGPRGLVALCSDAATADALQLALHGERQRDALAAAAHRSRNARMTALGNHKACRGWWFCSY